ncbi:MAG: 1-phosphofructokinase family hexose kinase [Actinobacteria bacterium]|nr:1-phosphofructokinase family hexose kinase [Actinomycetota bacterium]
MAGIVTLTLNPTVDLAVSTARVTPEDKLRCSAPRRDPGGGGVNVARAASRLGADALAVLPTGGPSGELLRQLLAGEDLPVGAVGIAGETRESWTVDETSSEDQYRFVLPGPSLSDDELAACLAAVDEHAETLVVGSGSLPPDVGDDTWARLVRSCADAGVRTIVDTSGMPLRAAVDAGVWLIKPNLRELGDLVERELSDDSQVRAAAEELLGAGTEAVVVSMGAGGAMLVTAERVEHVRSPTVPIRSRVGAGDSTVAGIASSLLRGEDLVTAVRWGVAAGAAAVMTEGSELCRRADTERLFRELSG